MGDTLAVLGDALNEIQFLHKCVIELAEENAALKAELKKARKAKKRFKRKYLEVRRSL